MADRISSLDFGYTTGDLSIFPEALDSRELLYIASNNSKTPLVQTLTYNGKVVIVGDTTGFPDSGIIRVGCDTGVTGKFELISYGKKTGNTFQQLKRGFAGTTQQHWVPGDPNTIYVSNSVTAEPHNSIKDAITNIQADLGLSVDPSPTSLNGILQAQEVRFLTPKPLFSAFPVKGAPSLTVRFQNFTTGHVMRYFWDFGDGSVSLERSPIHTYVNEGFYTVRLNVITSTGAQGIATKTNYIEVNADESLPFFYVESTVQPYSTQTATANSYSAKEFLFIDQTDGDIVQRNWIFGDGVIVTEDDPNIHTASHTYAVPGTYTVSLLVIFNNRRSKKVELADPLEVL